MAAAETQKLRVFISYSRDDLAFADQLFAGLEALGFAPTLDRIGISGAADWRETLRGMILRSDTVVYVLSPSSARSEMCAEEVAIAESLAKRIIPVVCRPLEEAPVPKRLQDLNYIFFYPEVKSPGSGFGAGLGKLKVALETDQDWMQLSTRYADRATEWQDGGRKPERLLQGTDIAEAQTWVQSKPPYAPAPSALQIAFIDTSVKAETERVAAQAVREATARDGEIRRIKAEQEAERLRLDTAKITAERSAALADSRRRRQQLLISLPALLLAFAGAAGVYWQRQILDSERRDKIEAKQQEDLANARAENERLKADRAASETAALKQLTDVRQSVRAAGPTAKSDDYQVAAAGAPAQPSLPPAARPTPEPPRGAQPPGSGAGRTGASTSGSSNPGSSSPGTGNRGTNTGGTAPTTSISPDAAELMAAFEIGDELNYRRRLGKPIWPGAQSGVVIGIGYDLGYVTPDECERAWKSHLPASDFDRLKAVVGIKGDAAKERLAELDGVAIPYDVAKAVFQTHTLPQYTARTLADFPNANELHPDALGALVSLVYNRGTSLGGPSRLEMKAIYDLMQRREFAAVPAQFRAMKRLWPTLPGLQQRREAEAVLFEKGLAAQAVDQKSKS